MYSVCITADKATGVLFYNLLPCIFSLSAIVEFFYFSPSVPLLHELHSMPYWMCCVTPALVLNPILLFSSGDCNFEGPYTACGYSQGKDDDFEWEQANTMERPSPNPWMPTGQSSSSSSFSPLPLPIQTESPWKTENPITHSLSICSYCIIRERLPKRKSPPLGMTVISSTDKVVPFECLLS